MKTLHTIHVQVRARVPKFVRPDPPKSQNWRNPSMKTTENLLNVNSRRAHTDPWSRPNEKYPLTSYSVRRAMSTMLYCPFTSSCIEWPRDGTVNNLARAFSSNVGREKPTRRIRMHYCFIKYL